MIYLNMIYFYLYTLNRSFFFFNNNVTGSLFEILAKKRKLGNICLLEFTVLQNHYLSDGVKKGRAS